jgi:hypothetical protein
MLHNKIFFVAGGVAQAVDHLPSNHETWCSNPSSQKGKKKNLLCDSNYIK